jgi:adenylate kinase
VRELDSFLEGHGTALDAVIELVADPDVVVGRLRKRAIEQGRSDDDEAVVRHRLEVYREQTEPLIDVYDGRGVLIKIDALGEIDHVTERIVAALTERGIVLPDAAAI